MKTINIYTQKYRRIYALLFSTLARKIVVFVLSNTKNRKNEIERETGKIKEAFYL